MARRLAERGVRMTQIYYGNGQPWDDHGDINNHRNHAQRSDRAIAALLRDLKARGLLEETLVLWGGEFGRTPTSKAPRAATITASASPCGWPAAASRAAWPTAPPTNSASHAVENRVHVHDLHATILHLMGIDHEKLTFRYSGRDFRLTDVHGSVVQDIIA